MSGAECAVCRFQKKTLLCGLKISYIVSVKNKHCLLLNIFSNNLDGMLLNFASPILDFVWHLHCSGMEENVGQIQKRIRRFRLLSEVVQDAKEWISKPWTSFYRGSKTVCSFH